jgi:hypothetical protein
MPRPVIPEQDISPWVRAVTELSSNRVLYEHEAGSSSEAAQRFVSTLRADGLEKYLAALEPATSTAPTPAERIERLSSDRRALLLQRLRQRRTD